MTLARLSQFRFAYLRILLGLLLITGTGCDEDQLKRKKNDQRNNGAAQCRPKQAVADQTALKPTADHQTGFNVRAGKNASRSDYPGVGMLWLQNGVCTASLICPNVVLTAAHCLEDIDDDEIEFHLAARPGKPPRRTPEGNGEDSRVRYVKSDLSQDIALIRLDRDVDGPYVDLAAKNALQGSDQLKEKLTIVGYGLNKGTSLANSSGSGIKRSGTVLFNLFLAAGKNGRKYEAGTFSPVGGLDDDRDSQLACAGDSGGPIMSGGAIVGVVNVGINVDRNERGISCETGDAVTFSMVKEHRSWIDDTMTDWCSGPAESDGEPEDGTDTSSDLKQPEIDPLLEANLPECVD